MLINEGGLIRAIKRAYKAGGYTVLNTGNDVAIYTDHWFAMANRALLPRKVLATIVEHMGMIPERDMPTSIIKDTEPQLVLRETAADDMDHWRGGDRGEEVTMVPVIMQGFQIYQPPGGGACWGVPLYLVDMIERDPAEHIGADVIDKDRLLWEADGEAVVIKGRCRAARVCESNTAVGSPAAELIATARSRTDCDHRTLSVAPSARILCVASVHRNSILLLLGNQRKLQI